MVQNPPEGYHAIQAYPMVEDPHGFVQFLKDVFGATQNGGIAEDGQGGILHADFQIGDSHLMFGGATPTFPATIVSLYCFLDDVDDVYGRAIAAGCTSIREPVTEFYGDRVGGFRDKWGNTWMVAQHVEDVGPEEMEKRHQAYVASMAP